MKVLFMISAALIAGLLMSRVVKIFKLPAVTAYLIAGILIGPFCLGALGIDGLGFTSAEDVSSLSVISDVALGFIASNIAANMMGLGSAATPFGLKAMSELQKINDKKDTASVAMITFLVLNTAGVTIVPTTVLALRIAHGSANPSEIILPGVIATFCSSIGGLLLDYYIRKRSRK